MPSSSAALPRSCLRDTRSRWILYLGLLGSLATGCAAAGEGVQRASEPPLQRRVSLSATGLPLEEVLDRIDPEHRLHLRAVRHLREKRMTLLAHEETVQHLMDGLAELWSLPGYPARWVREKDRSGYELWQSPDVLKVGERREAADRAQMGRYLEQLAQKPVEDPDPFNKTVQVGPQSGNWGMAWCAAAGALLRELTPENRAALLAGREIRVSPQGLSPRAQQVLYVNIASRQRNGTLRAGGDPENPDDIIWETDEERSQRFQRETVALVLYRNDREGRWNPQIRVLDPEKPNRTPSTSVVGPQLGFSEEAEEGANGPVGGKEASPRSGREKPSSRTGPETQLSERERSALAAATAEGPKTMLDAEQLLHRVTGRPVIADYYSHRGGTFEARQKLAFAEAMRRSGTEETLLRTYGTPVNYRGTARGRALVLRNRMWWVDDLREVPLPLARQLASALKTRGYLDLDELARAALLTPEQLVTLGADYVPSATAEGVEAQLLWLRLYGSLDPTLQGRLRAPTGLSLAELPVVNQALLAPSDGRVPLLLRSYHPNDAGATRLRIYQERATRRITSLPGKDGGPAPPPHQVPVVRTWFRLEGPTTRESTGLDQPLPTDGAPEPAGGKGEPGK